MDDLTIETREHLTSWLASHHGFPDLFVLRMEPKPQRDGRPLMPGVILDLATQIDGGFEAGERRRLRVFRIMAEETETFWIEDPKRYDSSYCNDSGIRQLDIDRPGIQLQVPGMVQLVAKSLVVRELEDRTEIIQPWIDELELAVQVQGYELPSPADWVELFAQEGVAVVWRRYQEGPQPADAVPADYTGWYLQQPGRFVREEGDGLFFFGATPRDGSFVIHLQNHDPFDPTLWRAMQRILLHYPNIEIRTGNCRLNATQWQQFVKEGYVV